nr:hypothetical protein [uncultured Mediterranean phage uvMED]
MSNPFIVDSEDSVYISHKAATKSWYKNKEELDVNYLMIDTATMRFGWGAYSPESGYSYVWQKDLFTPMDKPSDDHKKAFSVWVLPKYVDGDKNIEHAPCLWQRHSFGEYSGFQQMGASFYEESLKPENQNKLPVVKWVGSEAMSVGMGNTAIPKFELAAFKERPDNFIIPSWVSSEEGEAKADFLPKEPSSDAKTSTFEDDEIPF